MAVVMPNADLTAHKRAHPASRDAHGLPVLGPAPAPIGPYPGAVVEPDDLTSGQAYRLRVDPAVGELRPGDAITDEQDRTFIVRTARLVSIPGQDDVDFIRVNADMDPPKVP